MSGKRGRSGRKPLPIALHLARNTYRRDRHGPLPAIDGSSALNVEAVQPLPVSVTRGLGAPGAAFVAATFSAYAGWSPVKLLLLRRVGELVDAQVALGGASGSKGRLWLATHRALLQTLGRLELGD